MNVTIQGYVADIRFEPGNPSGELYVSLRGEPGTVTILLRDPDAVVKLENEKFLAAGLVKLLYGAGGRLFFTCEELPGRYRTCLVGKFTVAPK